MRSKDMRTWIADLEAAGELIRIDKPVDPLTEMGSLLYQSREKALLVRKSAARLALLGSGAGQYPACGARLRHQRGSVVPFVAERMGQRIKPVMVDDGPVKEVKLGRDEFDLTQLPVHVAGQRDGGPVIGSGLVVSKDPDTGQRNVSFHRLQIKGPHKSGILLYPRHTWKNYLKYQERNEPMPVAIFIGHHPLYYAAAATTAAYGLDEFEIAGGYLGEPVRLVKCETVDLEVPADAEIVLEGHIPPHYREEEGPFSEFQDYYVTGTGKNPIVEYQYMTRRHDAIFKNLQNGSEMEGCVFHKIPMSAAIFRRLKNVGGGPNMHNVMALPGIFGLVVQMTPRAYGEAKNVLMAALVIRIPASENGDRRRCRCRYFQSVRDCSGRCPRASIRRRTWSSSPAPITTPWTQACRNSARRAPRCGSVRLEDADRRDHSAARRCRQARDVRANSSAQSATASRRLCGARLARAGAVAFSSRFFGSKLLR